jgi:tRNA1(Val) A37 N6-methylase TrmN6
LLEGKKGGAEGFRILPPLYIEEENGSYSPEADELFNAYKTKEL